jgi:hypothetical protein
LTLIFLCSFFRRKNQRIESLQRQFLASLCDAKTADIFSLHAPSASGGTQFPLKMQLLLLKTFIHLVGIKTKANCFCRSSRIARQSLKGEGGIATNN